MQQLPTYLLVGNLPDIAPEDFDRWSDASADLRRADDLPAALRLLAAPGPPPEVIVLVQSRPGQWSDEAIRALQSAAPLARVWRLSGSWCEGETRSGRPPAGCVSTPWHLWPARIAQEQARAAQGCAPTWALPLTASADERGLAAAEHPPEQGHGLVAICARQTATAAALADACRLGGYETVPLGTASVEARIVLWDTTSDEMAQPAAVARVQSLAPAAGIVAIVGFPRGEDLARATAAGVAVVVAKPYSIHDLLWQIARVALKANMIGVGRTD